MSYIITLSTLTTIVVALKYHRYKIEQVKLKAYHDGYAMGFFTKETTPLFIRDSKGNKENSQAW